MGNTNNNNNSKKYIRSYQNRPLPFLETTKILTIQKTSSHSSFYIDTYEYLYSFGALLILGRYYFMQFLTFKTLPSTNFTFLSQVKNFKLPTIFINACTCRYSHLIKSSVSVSQSLESVQSS